MEYVRKCPQCKDKIWYNSKLTYVRAVNKNTICRGCSNYNTNPFPFTKSEFCEDYYNEGLTMSAILQKYNYMTNKIGKNGESGIFKKIIKRFNLPLRRDVILLRKKRFVTKNFNKCPITGETSDYLVDGNFNRAYRNLVDRFSNGCVMKKGSSLVANTPNLTIRQLRLRTLLEKYTDTTICCQCVNIKPKSNMCVTFGLLRTCKECVLPKQREKAKEYAKNKRNSLGNEEYNKKQREWRKNISPEKKYEYYIKQKEWRSNQPNWGNKPMSKEEIHWRRLLHLTVRLLGTEKTTSTYYELGYGPEELFNIVGPKKDGNDLDHKIPISWFKKRTPAKIVNSLENLQWVKSTYNRSKQDFWFDDITVDFFNLVKPYIKKIRIHRFICENDFVYDISFGKYMPELILE